MSFPWVLPSFIHMSRSERLFVFFSMLCGFCIAAEYAVIRPASNAIFLTVFSAKAYPWAWLAILPLNFLTVSFYNRLLPKIGPIKMLYWVALIAIATNIVCFTLLQSCPQIIFLHYLWKEIYILLMFKQLWSMIHSTISSEKAKSLYGWIFVMGTVGSILGSALPGFLAVELGSRSLFLFSTPLYVLAILGYAQAFKRSSLTLDKIRDSLTEKTSTQGGFSLIRSSSWLTGILLLVIFMQASIGVTEYLFNLSLEGQILDQDLRTQFCGRLMGTVNLLSLFLQALGGILIIRFLGTKKSHLIIPVTFACLMGLCWVFPSFFLISTLFVLVKSVDFSLFGILRETLYTPLRLSEKFQAKAIIDVFAYRSSKALISLFILLLQIISSQWITSSLSLISLVIFTAWIAVVFWMFRKEPLQIKAG